VALALVPVAELFNVKSKVSFSVMLALKAMLFVVVLVPFTVIDALPLVASIVRLPPVPFASVWVIVPVLLLVNVRLPTVIAAERFVVCVAVGELNVADAPIAFGKPAGVQLPLTFQLFVPDVKLNVCAWLIDVHPTSKAKNATL
jgi:hypothetical protein